MLITSYQFVQITLLRKHDQKHLILTGAVVFYFLVFGRFVARLNHSDVMTDAEALKKILCYIKLVSLATFSHDIIIKFLSCLAPAVHAVYAQSFHIEVVLSQSASFVAEDVLNLAKLFWKLHRLDLTVL